MASVRDYNGKLFCDFRYKGKRCREYTLLTDTKANRQKLGKLLEKIEAEIKANAFDYATYFPNSKLVKSFAISIDSRTSTHPASINEQFISANQLVFSSPLFKDFAEKWFDECKIGWRKSYVQTMRDTIDKHMVPYFGEKVVSSIRREDILDFRSQLAKVPGRKGQTLSARRINAIVLGLRQILNEAADRYNFTSPGQRIKPLKIKRLDIKPFTLDEVNLILKTVRPDYRDYFIIRFFTGMRTGEIHGLKWKYVDFRNRQILIRETLVGDEMEEEGKTDLSIREIFMSDVVYDAFMRQREVTNQSAFVFCNSEGKPYNLNNLTNRVWYPLLRYLGLELRRPYTSRHTAATLWLAAGENPEWIAKQMGHSTTEMLFRVYSRYVPNLTRNDGSAFNRLLSGNLVVPLASTNLAKS
ncbi:MAG: Arm DNA-binding domain-containing protein [Methylophilus sp.]|uniref:Arm DNA-binding domain-containing protein n=2 Tax=Methylophilus sp. TaxID=29541 RepID=UPI0040373786